MVLLSAQLPGNWKGFLWDNDNKTNLFEFIAKNLCEKQFETGKQLVTTIGDKVQCCPRKVKDSLQPCTHEEADTRVLLYADDCARSGLHKVLFRTTDTDVLVAFDWTFPQNHSHRTMDCVWMWENFRYNAVHGIANSLEQGKARAILAFPVFTGCDTVSFFAGTGKKTAWNTWNAFPETTN
jgi:hypothetical protein